jgi:uncharacterized membrane protein YcfT
MLQILIMSISYIPFRRIQLQVLLGFFAVFFNLGEAVGQLAELAWGNKNFVFVKLLLVLSSLYSDFV